MAEYSGLSGIGKIEMLHPQAKISPFIPISPYGRFEGRFFCYRCFFLYGFRIFVRLTSLQAPLARLVHMSALRNYAELPFRPSAWRRRESRNKQKAAGKLGESLNGFINRAITEAVERDGK
jgi:hypothetical protein